MIVEEESVTRVGFVIIAKTPQLSKRKYLQAMAERLSLEILMLRSPKMQKGLLEEVRLDRQAEISSRKMFNPDWCR